MGTYAPLMALAPCRHVLTPPPLSGDMAVVFFEFSLSPTDKLALFPLFLAFRVGFVRSPFRRMGVGFEEPHLRLMF